MATMVIEIEDMASWQTTADVQVEPSEQTVVRWHAVCRVPTSYKNEQTIDLNMLLILALGCASGDQNRPSHSAMAPGNKKQTAASTASAASAASIASTGVNGSSAKLQGKKDNAAEKEPEDTLNQNLKRLGQLENQVINECLRRVADLQAVVLSGFRPPSPASPLLGSQPSAGRELQEELATARSAAAPRQADTSGAYDANQDIVGSVQAGYLSIQNGAVIVATHIQDDYYFGYQFTQPTNQGNFLKMNQGWFKAAQTRDFDRREFSEAS
ncbi:hypothetical protein AK812_SmicGene5502 [Symbiodinium microadriaticum]|uniref:Uncharacterized protein n=1 Tax=Symbiodinium microadriaticum TaxID=2951 RepID=A0A1Q9ETL7_SYMMI|nr:hypothetical protein AK812_SmicGene5502 [Symbiodinium microadriaticum]